MKANKLVMEANVLAMEMGKRTDFSVTLQIPACNLSPNRKVRREWGDGGNRAAVLIIDTNEYICISVEQNY